jgi:hypothetical protein
METVIQPSDEICCRFAVFGKGYLTIQLLITIATPSSAAAQTRLPGSRLGKGMLLLMLPFIALGWSR